MNLIFGQQLRCPNMSIRSSLCGLGSLRMFQKSPITVFGQMVTVPENRCSQISLQSCPKGRGSNSRWRRILRYFCRSSLTDVSIVEPRNPPRQPRPLRCVTGRPGEPLGEKKNRLIWGLTCETMEKLTLKWMLSAFNGISVRKLPSFHLLPKEYGTNEPSFVFRMSTMGLRIPGTAAEARTADHITQSGLVI